MSQSGHQYISNANSLFSDDNEVNDEMFLQNSRLKNPVDKMEEQRQLMVQKRQEIENRTLASSQRSVGLLRETENVFILQVFKKMILIKNYFVLGRNCDCSGIASPKTATRKNTKQFGRYQFHSEIQSKTFERTEKCLWWTQKLSVWKK